MHFIVIRYSELGLKGKNRNWFENLLMSNLRKHLAEWDALNVIKIHGRILVEIEGELDRIVTTLKFIPGIANFSVAHRSSHEMEEISQRAIQLVDEYIKKTGISTFSFKVESRPK